MVSEHVDISFFLSLTWCPMLKEFLMASRLQINGGLLLGMVIGAQDWRFTPFVAMEYITRYYRPTIKPDSNLMYLWK